MRAINAFLVAVLLFQALSCGAVKHKTSGVSLSGQNGSCAIYGTIRDEDGKAINDVELELRNKRTGISISCIPDSDGAYSFRGLPPGSGYLLLARQYQYTLTYLAGINLEPFSSVKLPIVISWSEGGGMVIHTPTIDYKVTGGSSVIYHLDKADDWHAANK